MLRLVTLNRNDLIPAIADKDLGSIGISDFKEGPSKEIVKSDIVVFIDGDRFKVLKNRLSTIDETHAIGELGEFVLSQSLPLGKKK